MKSPTGQLRIGDVARLAGVSPSTVSRVMAGSPRVNGDSRRRVLEVVSRFDYQPNRLAKNLRLGRAEVVGVVVSDIENPHFATMVRAIEDAAYERGKRVLLCNSSEDAVKQASYLEVMAAERVLGVLISPSDPGDAQIGRLLDLGIPVVAFDRHVDDPRADAITADNLVAARAGSRRLIDAGHRRIGFVGGRPGVETADDRLAGYRLEMEAAGLEARAVDGRFTVEGGRLAAEQLMAHRGGLSALLVGNNQMTLGALETLRQRGMAVPGDIALIAFDDPPWASLVEPPLTTLAQPLREMATAAVEVLFERMADGRSQPLRRVFPFELRVRRSCGTAAR